MTVPIQGLVPVQTFCYRIDELLIAYVEQLCPAVLLSLPELRHRQGRAFPKMPLLEEAGLGVLVFPDGFRISPQDVQAHIDPLRLLRALTLTVQPHPAGFTVSGGQTEHLVTPDLACDCPDHTTRKRCKHVLAVQLSQNHPDVLRMASVLADP